MRTRFVPLVLALLASLAAATPLSAAPRRNDPDPITRLVRTLGRWLGIGAFGDGLSVPHPTVKAAGDDMSVPHPH
jgi:hypothetical protein